MGKSVRSNWFSDITWIFLFSICCKANFRRIFKGLSGEEYFKKLGTSVREGGAKQVQEFKSYLTNLYRVFISKKLDDQYALAVVENIEGIVYYAVLNHKKSTEKLIAELPEAFVRAVGEVSLKRIPVTEPYIVQLYPNFETETWDYLFIPTVDGFGNFVDRYYDFNLNQAISINSRKEFYGKFDLNENDTYKYIISAKYHEEKINTAWNKV